MIINAYQKGNDKQEIAEIIYIKLLTVYRILTIYIIEERVDYQLRNGAKKQSVYYK